MQASKRILIAGGSGFLGEYLRRMFVSQYCEVYILSTQSKLSQQGHILYWSPYEKKINLKGYNSFDVIINLSGANIASHYWTKARMQELEDSRVLSTQYLVELIQTKKVKVNYFVQASAIGFYGDRESEKLTELSSKGQGFLADITQKWEAAIGSLSIPYSILRIGVVFHPKLGAFPKLIMGLKFRFMMIMGNGSQYISWIDIDDLCRMFYFAVGLQLQGTYNAVAPQSVQLIHLLKRYNKKFGGISIPIFIPSFLLRFILGKFSELFLNSQRVSSQKIVAKGFQFQVSDIPKFLKKYRKKIR